MAKLEKLKTLIPLHELEIGAQNQIYEVLEHDFLLKLAIMPDCHSGYSLPIGGVALLDGVISPAYVGYDIGCGMCTVITDIKSNELSTKDREKIYEKIISKIPTGFSMRNVGLRYEEFNSSCGDKELNKKVGDKLTKQLGTLGDGNHFIELGEDSISKNVAITIHSGSRNIGHSIGGFYMNKCSNGLPLGFFHVDCEMGINYIEDMNYALEYALANRKIMMEEVLSILGLNPVHSMKMSFINENHNHAIVTKDGVLHRKGATPADKGQIGIIPGNMRDGVYITEGLGNEEFLSSASHGAGRKLSRSKANKNLDLDRFKSQMKGIVCNTGKNILDEAPDAYKDVEKVIGMQEGVVINTIGLFKPIINIKADEGKRR